MGLFRRRKIIRVSREEFERLQRENAEASGSAEIDMSFLNNYMPETVETMGMVRTKDGQRFKFVNDASWSPWNIANARIDENELAKKRASDKQ